MQQEEEQLYSLQKSQTNIQKHYFIIKIIIQHPHSVYNTIHRPKSSQNMPNNTRLNNNAITIQEFWHVIRTRRFIKQILKKNSQNVNLTTKIFKEHLLRASFITQVVHQSFKTQIKSNLQKFLTGLEQDRMQRHPKTDF